MPLRGLKNIQTIILSPYFIAFLITFVVILILPDYFSKYKLELNDSGILERSNAFFTWCDLDLDGQSEELEIFINTEGKTTVKILNYKGLITGQWFFDGQMVPRDNRLFCGDPEGFGKIKVFVPILRNDSLFLNCFLPEAAGELLFKDQFITRVTGNKQKYDYGVNSFFLADLDHNGTKELLFVVSAGFSLQPRAIFALDLKNKTLIRSPLCGALIGISDLFDINHDGFPEIFCNCSAPANYPDTTTIPFIDKSAWLMVFDHTLHFLFQPVEFKSFTSIVNALPFMTKKSAFIIVHNHYRNHPAKRSSLLLYDLNGNTIRTLSDDDTTSKISFDIKTLGKGRDRACMLSTDGKIHWIGKDLKILKRSNIRNLHSTSPIFIDFDGDGEEELVFLNPGKNQLIITRNDFSCPVELFVPINENSYDEACLKLNGRNHPEIFIQSGNRYFTCSYRKNPLFLLKYPFYTGIYLCMLLFIWFIGKIQKVALRQKYNAEKKIAELQLLLLKDQMDPHFTFNVISSISSAVVQKKPEEATRIIQRLSDLMRSTVIHSDKLSRTLGEELEFVTNYLEVEKIRTDGKFDYKVEISPGVDVKWQVPKMVMQIYVENSLKHGLKSLPGKGMLTIRVKKDASDMIIEVEDNGVGRKRSSSPGSLSTGKGLAIMDQYYDTFNRYNEHKIKYEITDLCDGSGNSAGTKVTICIPVHFKYNLYDG
jgi:hypothetical protein